MKRRSLLGDLTARRQAIAGVPVFEDLGRWLGAQLDELEIPVILPRQKPLLSQDGGVCPVDGARLDFHPGQPHAHRCPVCGQSAVGERHDRAWAWRYHLWLSERALRAALLSALGFGDYADRASSILTTYVARYRDYPNRDNVLGPSRLFFSTYHESIWLLQVTMALSTLESEEHETPDAQDVVRESAGLIRSFDEGLSNRQVWNAAATLAAGAYLGDEAMLRFGWDGPHGVRRLLMDGVTETGQWHEGENYHFFALRGLLFGVGIAEEYDLVEPDLRARFNRMFVSVLDTALPDYTIPARGDSPYGMSLVQSRFAELYEVARGRSDDARIEAFLTDLYSVSSNYSEPTGSVADIAEVEYNRPPHRLLRSQLGWKALRWMSEAPAVESGTTWRTMSRSLSPSGPVVMNRETLSVRLEGAGTGQGHGHPDALNLTLYWDRAWLTDFGTGSYVNPSLHWYRSALSHNVPQRSGVGQLSSRSWCSAFAERGCWSWAQVTSVGTVGSESTIVRDVIVGPDYIFDAVTVRTQLDAIVDLPVHLVGEIELGKSEVPSVPTASASDEVVPVWSRLDSTVTESAVRHGDDVLYVAWSPIQNEQWFSVRAPGPASPFFGHSPDIPFLVRRVAIGASGQILAQAFARDSVRMTATDEGAFEISCNGHVSSILLDNDSVHVQADGETVVMRETRARPAPEPLAPPRRMPTIVPALLDTRPDIMGEFPQFPAGHIVVLEAGHYRRSEDPYPGRTTFSARVGLTVRGPVVRFHIDVVKSDLVFRAESAENPRLDNEVPDIHSESVQVYLDAGGWCGWLAVPIPDGSLRIRPTSDSRGEAHKVRGHWMKTADGYSVVVEVDVGRVLRKGDRMAVQTIVNAMWPERERRAGQLVLSGEPGWVYLRGDREPQAAAAIMEVV